MRVAILIILVIALTALVESSPGIGNNRRPAPYINRLPPPKPRFRRSANPEPQGSLSATWQKNLNGPERRPSYNVDYQHKLFENKHGSISATAGAQKFPGQRWQPNVGIQGSFRFRRSPEPQPEPQGSLSATWQKNLNGPERRPSYNVDYQHKLFENKHGSISATAGAQKFPGQRWQPNVGVQGSFRFRRSPEPQPEPQGSLSATWQKNLNGPERRPSYNVDYQHKLFENKHGSISATAGAQKFPGQRWQPNVGVQGSFRFRRSPEPQPEPQGSLSATWQKNLNGPERRPSYNVDYQHKLFENKHGSISATAGAQKFPGQRWQPNVGVQGSFRFRRSPEPQPEPQGSLSATWQKNLNGPERRPSYNVDYQHKLFENKHGSISATAGAQKFPGQRWQPNVGVQGSFRFRRSPEPQPEPQGSLSATWQKNLNGPERRPSYNVDYQHKLFENKHGSISATAGAQKFPGQRWQPNVGVQGSFRFRRSPEPQPEPQGSLSATWQKNLNGPERRPSYNVDYQHKLFENKHGSISATAGAQKFPGQRWQPNVGVQGSFRFRRSPEPQPEPQGSLSATWQKNLNGPERRPSYNVDYQHKLFENKHGSISATAGAQKFPGQRWQPNVGVQGSFRFRRSPEPQPEPQGSLSATWQKNLNGPERRPSYNVDYQHKLFENKHGSISATAGAQKFPGQRWQPNVGVQGSFRFRRSAQSDSEGENGQKE